MTIHFSMFLLLRCDGPTFQNADRLCLASSLFGNIVFFFNLKLFLESHVFLFYSVLSEVH